MRESPCLDVALRCDGALTAGHPCHGGKSAFQRKSRKVNPQKLTQLSLRSHPRHLVGKRTAQKDITIDTTSDNQVNSNFPKPSGTARA